MGIHSPGPQRSERTVATAETTSFSSACMGEASVPASGGLLTSTLGSETLQQRLNYH